MCKQGWTVGFWLSCFKGLLMGRFKFKLCRRTLAKPRNWQSVLAIFHPMKTEVNSHWSIPWNILNLGMDNSPGLCLLPRPRATFQPPAQGVLCSSLSSAAQPEPGAPSTLAPARSSSSAGKWNTGTKYGRETQETPLRPTASTSWEQGPAGQAVQPEWLRIFVCKGLSRK